MAIPNVEVSFLPILIATLISMAIGMYWYSPSLFGRLWIRLSEIKISKINKEKKKGMALTYIIAFAAALITSYVIANFIKYTTAEGFAEGARGGFWLWLGIVAPTTLGVVLWEGKPFKLWLLNNSYNLLSLIVIGGILAVWG